MIPGSRRFSAAFTKPLDVKASPHRSYEKKPHTKRRNDRKSKADFPSSTFLLHPRFWRMDFEKKKNIPKAGVRGEEGPVSNIPSAFFKKMADDSRSRKERTRSDPIFILSQMPGEFPGNSS